MTQRPRAVPRVLRRLWLALAGALALSACTGPDQRGKEELSFWTIGREGEAVAQLLPAFEAEHPGIHVKLQQLPLTAAHQKLLTAFAGNSTPDLSQLGNTWLPEMVALDALVPLDARINPSKVIQPEDYFPSIWAPNRLDGHTWGIPWYIDTRLLFYRKDLLRQAGFAQPPRDWAQWSAMLAKVSDASQGRWGALLPTNEYEQLLSLALEQPDPLLRDGGRYGNFRSAGFKRALAYYVAIFQRGQAPAATNVQIGNPWEEFMRGAAVFYLSGPWNIGEFRKRFPADVQDDWSTAPLPSPEPGGAGGGIAGGSSLVIFRRSTHQQAAWQLIEYLSRPAVQQRFYELLGDMPPRRSAWQGGVLAGDPAAQAFREQLEHVRPTPAVPEWEQIATEMQNVAAQAVAGRLSVDQAAAEIDRRADAILAKRRWMLDHGRATP